MNFPKIIVTLVIGYLSFVAYSSGVQAAEDLEEITIQIMEADDDAHEFINRIELPPAVTPQPAPAAGREEKRLRREHERAGDDMDDGEHAHAEKNETGHAENQARELPGELREHEAQGREEVRAEARQDIEDRKGDSREEARAEAEAQQEETRSETRQQIEENRATTKDEIRDQQDEAQSSAGQIRDDAVETVDDNATDDKEIDEDIPPTLR
ncbi:MAG: hypothetical protein ACE5ET_04470 [Gammaproteobacteria bacterium]